MSLVTNYDELGQRAGKSANAKAEAEEKQQAAQANLRDFCADWPLVALTIGVDAEAEQHGVYLPGIDLVLRDSIRAAAHALAQGATFTAAERSEFYEHSLTYAQKALTANEAVKTLLGEKHAAFEPFTEWAEGLCVDKHGIVRLEGANGVTVTLRNDGLLKASMRAVLLSLTSGRKWEGLTVKMARQALTTELAGASEEITALGSLHVIGRDNSADGKSAMTRLAERLDESVTSLQKGDCAQAEKAIFSQVRYTGISTTQFIVVVQAMLYARYARACQWLSETAARVAKDGAKAEAVQPQPAQPTQSRAKRNQDVGKPASVTK